MFEPWMKKIIIEEMKKTFECINEECGWKGKKKDCLTFKHGPEYLMCPECNEHVEEAPSMAQEEPPQNTMEAGQNNGQQAKVSICQHAVSGKYLCLKDGLLCQGQCGAPTEQAC